MPNASLRAAAGRVIGFLAIVALLLQPATHAEAAARSGPKAKAGKAKPAPKTKKAAPVPVQPDPVSEWEQLNGEALALREVLEREPGNEQATQALGLLALRSTRAAERALSRGDEDLFRAYREQIEINYRGLRPRIEVLSSRRIAAADFALGVLALHGIMEDRSVDRACALFLAAVEKGFGGAKFRLAQCLDEQDPERATNLLREAADSGHIAAIELQGRRCLESTPPDIPCAYSRLDRAAREGRSSARTLLGWMHAEGMGGRPNFALAAKLYAEAAQQGEAAAHNNLGELLENGRGVKQDANAAFRHYREAAESGFPPAQFNLGRLYAAGKGVEPDLAEARRWLARAAQSGIESAAQIIELLDREKPD